MKKLGRPWHMKWAGWAYYICYTEYYISDDGKKKQRIHYLHRWIVDATENEYVDHKDNNTFNNLEFNLRITTNSKNNQNRKGKNLNNTSGYRNVSWFESYKKWVVQLQINGKNAILGMFDDVHEAGRFAEKMRKKYYKEYKGCG